MGYGVLDNPRCVAPPMPGPYYARDTIQTIRYDTSRLKPKPPKPGPTKQRKPVAVAVAARGEVDREPTAAPAAPAKPEPGARASHTQTRGFCVLTAAARCNRDVAHRSGVEERTTHTHKHTHKKSRTEQNKTASATRFPSSARRGSKEEWRRVPSGPAGVTTAGVTVSSDGRHDGPLERVDGAPRVVRRRALDERERLADGTPRARRRR